MIDPYNHRFNEAKQVMQTFKNNFITGLCTIDKDLPLQFWDKLL